MKVEKEPKYYEAYEERYREAHKKGVSWASDVSTPIVLDTIRKYKGVFESPIPLIM